MRGGGETPVNGGDKGGGGFGVGNVGGGEGKGVIRMAFGTIGPSEGDGGVDIWDIGCPGAEYNMGRRRRGDDVEPSGRPAGGATTERPPRLGAGVVTERLYPPAGTLKPLEELGSILPPSAGK